MELDPGQKVQSAVCGARFVVIRAPAEEVDLRCGGLPVLAVGGPQGQPGPPRGTASGQGALLGKRYAHDCGVELLCVAPGTTLPSVGEEILILKSAKPLPASD